MKRREPPAGGARLAATLKVSEVKVPKGRLRPLGDVTALRESIAAVGLLQPIVVTADYVLVSGLHRLTAVKQLGHETIQAQVISLDELHTELAEIDENLVRNELTVLERAEHLKRRTDLLEASEGKNKGGRPSKTQPTVGVVSPKTTEEVGAEIGLSKTGVKRDVQIARDLDSKAKESIRNTPTADSTTQLLKLAQMPAKDQRAVAKRIESGEASSVTEAVRQVKKEALADAPPLTAGERKYRVIYADPPWQYNDTRGGLADYSQTAAADHYPTMSVEELSALDVRGLAEDDAALFCWATFPLLPDALAVVKAWGFTYKTAFVWAKGRPNFGHYHNASAELLLVCTRGSGTPDADKREDQVQTVVRTGRHSEKPEEFRAMIDRLYTSGSRIELFRRGAAPAGWDVFGNEAAHAS